MYFLDYLNLKRCDIIEMSSIQIYTTYHLIILRAVITALILLQIDYNLAISLYKIHA